MEMMVHKVLTEQKTIFSITQFAFSVEITIVLIIAILTHWILAFILFLFMHPILIFIIKKDVLIVDIFLQNINNPKELGF